MIAIDTETFRFGPGNMAPELVCVSWAKPDGSRGVENAHDGASWLLHILESGEPIVGQNIAYDLRVLWAWAERYGNEPLYKNAKRVIFEAYERGQVHDTKVRQQLLDLARGELKWRTDGQEVVRTEYSLKALAKRHLGLDLDKSTWRLGYEELARTPIADWPEGAREYAQTDAVATLRIYLAQEAAAGGGVINEAAQVRAAWALHLMTVEGIQTDPEHVERLRRTLSVESEATRAWLLGEGIYYIKNFPRAKRQETRRSTAALQEKIRHAYAARGRQPPLTEKGAIKIDEETCRLSGDPDLQMYAAALAGDKLLTAFVPTLERGTQAPLHASYDCLKETGRTGCFDPNLQQLPRSGGVRECFIPPPGYLLCSVDYDEAELRSLSQVCLDFGLDSAMARAFREGRKPHLEMAAALLRIPYAEAAARIKKGDHVVEEARQMAKVANFGFPGGMQAETLIEYAAGYGLKLTDVQALTLQARWGQAWPEMAKYFDTIRFEILKGQNVGVIRQVWSGRIRGGVRYTAACNSFFQGLTADGAKQAIWDVARECYLEHLASPLYGTRPLVFIHDEVLAAVPEERATEASDRLAQVMREGMAKAVRDVPVTASPALMARWFKGAKEVRDASGRLLPWQPAGEPGRAA